MNQEFEEIYKLTNEKITLEKQKVNEHKKDIRQSEWLIIGIILVCLIISYITSIVMAKYIFITVAVMMFVFCTIYTFRSERKIIERQNKYSEIALSELAIHIKDGFTYEKDEEISGSYYRKSGFNKIYKELDSKGVISGKRKESTISVSNIIVRSQSKELFRGIFAYGTLKNEFEEIDVMRVNSKNNKKEKYEIPNQELFMYSENMRIARNIITDEILEDVRNFYEETGLKFEFMIHKNLIFFRFFDREILTKPIANDKQTKEYLYKYYRIIEFISNFIEKIDKEEFAKKGEE